MYPSAREKVFLRDLFLERRNMSDKLKDVPEEAINDCYNRFNSKGFGLFETPDECRRCTGAQCSNHDFMVGDWTIETTRGLKIATVPGHKFQECSLRARHKQANGVEVTVGGKVYGAKRQRPDIY